MELARVKRELAEARMERDLLKKRPCTLRRNRCRVRGHESHAIHIFDCTHVWDIEGLKERLLQRAQGEAIKA